MKVFSNVVAAVLGVFLCFLLVGAHFLFAFGRYVQPSSVKKMIDTIEVKDFLYNEDDHWNEQTDIEAVRNELNMSKEEFTTLLDSKTVKELATLYLNDVTKALTKANPTFEFTKEKVLSVLETNIDTIVTDIYGSKNEAKATEILDVAKKNIDKYWDKIPSAEDTSNDLNAAGRAFFDIILQNHLPWIMLGIAGVLAVIIALVLFHPYRFLIFLGVPILTASMAPLLVGVFWGAFLPFMERYASGFPKSAAIIMEPFGNTLLQTGLIGLAIGLGFVLLYAILDIALRKRKKSIDVEAPTPKEIEAK